MATTTKGVPYPTGSDNNDSATWFQALAEWIDDALGAKTTVQIAALSGADRWVGRTVLNSDTGQLMFWDGSNWNVASDPIGSVIWLSASSTPDGYLPADGTLRSRTTYARLFAKIGTAFGVGDGSTTFGTPNLKGRTVFGFDGAQTEFNVVGETGGAKTVTLSTANLAAHTHTGPSHTHSTPNHTHPLPSHTHPIDHNHPVVSSTNSEVTFSFEFDYVLWASPSKAGFVLSLAAGANYEFSHGAEGEFIQGGLHSHAVDIPNFSGTSGSGGSGNTSSGGASTTGAAGTGATGSAGSGTAFSILPPYVALVPYIKY